MLLTEQQIGQIETEIARQPAHVQEHYHEMVLNGQSQRFAAMCAMRQAPLTRYSDRTFTKARNQIFQRMKPKMQKAYLEMAKKAGISTQGKFYVGGLGRPTDPMAWVSTIDDAKEVCKRKNLTADGLVRNEGVQMGPPKKVRMAKDIQAEAVRNRLAQDPSLAAACAKDPTKLRSVAGEVVDRHARSCKP